ncbi:MAG TPA: hypothetical protein DIS90_15055 [Cytophagales bacterium]|nr:hypothetical protein [Cytophagales bacterium]
MIMVGITATMVIVMSQAMPELTGPVKEKAKTEQTENGSDKTILSAPSDVVPGGIVQVSDVDRHILETFINEEQQVLEFRSDTRILTDYFNILFRAIISPNAP